MLECSISVWYTGTQPAVKKAVSLPARVSQPEMPRLTRAVHWQKHDDDDAYTSVHVSKEHKDVSM